MNMTIRQRIIEIQRGRSGIYPYRVAQQVANEFLVSMPEAIEHVMEHIKHELSLAITLASSHD
jgi:hypothetical protein